MTTVTSKITKHTDTEKDQTRVQVFGAEKAIHKLACTTPGLRGVTNKVNIGQRELC